MGEFMIKIVWVLLVGVAATAAWVTDIQGQVRTNTKQITEQDSDIKLVLSKVNKIEGWVDAQPKPKRRD